MTLQVAECPRCGWRGLAGDCAYLDDRGLGIDPICPACWEEALPTRTADGVVLPPVEKPFRIGSVVVVREGEFPAAGRVIEINPPGDGRTWNTLSVETADGNVRYFPAFDRRLSMVE